MHVEQKHIDHATYQKMDVLRDSVLVTIGNIDIQLRTYA